MKNNIKNSFLPISLFISIVIGSLLWNKINFSPTSSIIENFPDSNYVKNNFNHLNEIFRYCVFVFLPSLTYILFLISNREFQIPILKKSDQSKKQIKKKDNSGLMIFCFVLLIFVVNFFFYKFPIKNWDGFHDGMYLTAGENYFHYKTFWKDSFITIGWGYEFLIPILSFKIFDSTSIANIRSVIFFLKFLNQLILLYFAYKFSFEQNLSKNLKKFIFLILTISIFLIGNFYHPLLVFREMPLVIFLILVWFLLNGKYKNISLFLLGAFSCLSIVWGLDRGAYFNAALLFFIAFILLNKQIKNFFLLSFYIFFGWLVFYFSLGGEEFNHFLKNTSFIYGNMDYIHGLIHPAPFYGDIDSSRAGKNLLFIVIASLLTIKFSLKKNSNLSLANKIFFTFLFFLAFITYKTGLSRSDSGHMRVGAAFCIINLVLIFTIQITLFINNNLHLVKKINYINNFLVLIFVGIVGFYLVSKGGLFNNNGFNIIKFTKLENNFFIPEKEMEKYRMLKNEFNKNDCIQNLTYDTAIPYMISKPSCNKFYFPWSIAGKEIEKNYIDLLISSKTQKVLIRKDYDFPEANFKRRFKNLFKFLEKEYRVEKEIGDYIILIKN